MIIGVDIGGTTIKAALIQDRCIRKLAEYPTSTESRQHFLETLYKSIHDVSEKPVKAIGVGCPGPGDYRNGVILRPPNLPLHNFNLKKAIEQEFHIPTIIANDANCFTLAQTQVINDSCIVGVTLGTGFGIGIVINGVIHSGRASASEISQLPWRSSVLRTQVTEDVISAGGLLRIARRNGLKCTTAKHVYLEARKNNKKALSTFVSFGQELGKILSIPHALLDADTFVLGGDISGAWKYFAPALKKGMSDHSPFRLPRIVKSSVKHAGIIGASMLVE
ncbi:MAG: ROK family protein [Nanoarchaeota archaeon]